MVLDRLTKNDRKRIKSWQKEATKQKPEKYEKRFIFYWIAFNSYYSAKYINKSGKKTGGKEITKINDVLHTMLTEKEAKILLPKMNRNISTILNNTTRGYYTKYKNDYRKEINNRRNKDGYKKLIILIERIRNRLFHGGKTYDHPESGNKHVINASSNIIKTTLKFLMDKEKRNNYYV